MDVLGPIWCCHPPVLVTFKKLVQNGSIDRKRGVQQSHPLDGYGTSQQSSQLNHEMSWTVLFKGLHDPTLWVLPNLSQNPKVYLKMTHSVNRQSFLQNFIAPGPPGGLLEMLAASVSRCNFLGRASSLGSLEIRRISSLK